MCFSSYFTALGRPVRSFIVSLSGTLIFPAVLLFILAPAFGLNGIWFDFTAASVLIGLLTLIMAKKMKI